MLKTLSAKGSVELFDSAKTNSKYGNMLKMKTKADRIGHLNNILNYREKKENDSQKVVVSYYDNMGKRIKFKKFTDFGDSSNRVLVPIA